MVYVDEPKARAWCRGASCHLLPHTRSSDGLRELHLFAQRIGLWRDGFQPGRWPHYSLTRARRLLAIDAGACMTTLRSYIADTCARERAGGVHVTRTIATPPTRAAREVRHTHGPARLDGRELLGIQLAEHLQWLEAVTRFDQSLQACQGTRRRTCGPADEVPRK